MIEEVVTVVPAANEAERISACLAALLVAGRAAPSGVRVRVVVVLDGCTDGTAAVLTAYPTVEVVTVTDRCVGRARAAGAERALRTATAPTRLWIANTDADSTVPAGWIGVMLAAARSGADLVLGTVRPDGGLTGSRRREWHRQHESGDGHPHVHGANLGVRASAYRALGGWRPLPTGEDVDLAERAAAAGLVIHRSGAMTVTTSARTVGRAPEGFSSYLRDLDLPVPRG